MSDWANVTRPIPVPNEWTKPFWDAARREVLDRLLLLNHERHEQEVKAGLFEAKGAKGKGAKAKKGKSVVNDGKVVSDGGLEQGALF